MTASRFFVPALSMAIAACVPAPTPAAVGVALPFKTVFVDGPGSSRSFAAGPSEQLQPRSQAELDAFLARHPRALPPEAVTGGMASPSPSRRLLGAPEAWPAALTAFDFGRFEAIAYFDGAVPLAAHTRITAVVPEAGALRVEAARWQAAGYGPDVNGRLHVIAVPKQGLPVRFAPLALRDSLAGPAGGSLSIGGGPFVDVRWRAVPDPDVTQEAVESLFRAELRGAVPTKLVVEKRTVAAIRQTLAPHAGHGYTDDSEMWVAIAEGDALPIGRSGPRAARIYMLAPIEMLMVQGAGAIP